MHTLILCGYTVGNEVLKVVILAFYRHTITQALIAQH